MARRPRPTPLVGTHSVSWLPTALGQLAEIEAFLADDPAYAGRVAADIRRAAASLDLFPGRGTPLGNGVHLCVVLNRYLLRYEFDDEHVDILGVRDGRRDV